MATVKSMKKSTAKKPTTAVKLECAICKQEKNISQSFFKTNQEEYLDTGGYCTTCKDCFRDMLVNPVNGMIERSRFENICKILDMPFIPFEYSALMVKPTVNPNNLIGEYRKLIAVKKEYKNLCYADSIMFMNSKEQIEDEAKRKIEAVAQVTEDMIEFWGAGFSPDYYLDVQKRFDKFMENEDFEKMDYAKENSYKTLCQLERKKTELLQQKNYDVKDLNSIVNMISKISEDLAIKAIQKKEDENNQEHYIMGLVIKWVENVKMQPIPKLEDIDWLGEMPKSEFDREMAMFKHEMLVEQGRLSPYQEVVDGMKKEFSPTDEDLSANVFDFEDDES